MDVSPARTRSAALVVGPGLVAYGVVRLVARADGRYGPGAAWLTGHAALFVALVGILALLAAALLGRTSRAPWFRVLLGIGVAGQLLALAQCALDLYAGATSATTAEMDATFARLHGHPLAALAYGPASLLGLVALAVLIVAAPESRAPRWVVAGAAVVALVCLLRLDLLPVAGAVYTWLLPAVLGSDAGTPRPPAARASP